MKQTIPGLALMNRKARMREFVDEMDRVRPGSQLVVLIEPREGPNEHLSTQEWPRNSPIEIVLAGPGGCKTSQARIAMLESVFIARNSTAS
jgi:hypothetical protein